MNTKFQSQILAAALVLASTSVSLQPTYAASNAVVNNGSVTLTSSKIDYRAVWDQIYALLKAGKVNQAMSVADQAINAAPDSAVPYVMKALVMYNGNVASETILPQLNKALSISPQCTDALYLRGLVYEDLNELQNAAQDFDTCIALDNHDLDSLRESIAIKFALEDWNGVVSVSQVAIENNQVTDGMVYFARAFAEFKIGQTSAAIADFKQSESLFVAANDSKHAELVSKILEKMQAA